MKTTIISPGNGIQSSAIGKENHGTIKDYFQCVSVAIVTLTAEHYCVTGYDTFIIKGLGCCTWAT
jgi:hypothetical protein